MYSGCRQYGLRFVFVRVAETMSAGGIGLATVKTFLEANINGLLLVDQNQDALDHILKQLSADELDRCDSFVAGVSSERSNYVDYALQRWGRLDIAVLNAGIGSELNSILDTDVKIWDKIMEVNGRGGIPIWTNLGYGSTGWPKPVFLGLQQCARAMIKRNSGSIVITSSQLGLQGEIIFCHCIGNCSFHYLQVLLYSQLTALQSGLFVGLHSLRPRSLQPWESVWTVYALDQRLRLWLMTWRVTTEMSGNTWQTQR